MYSSMVATRPQTARRVLVADDQADVLEALRWLLTGEGYEPEFVSSTDAVLERLLERPFDLLLMDLNYSRDTTSGREGLELIPRVRVHDPALPIVVMTGWGSVDTAVEALRRLNQTLERRVAQSTADRIRSLTRNERMLLAPKADRAERAFLVQDSDPQVLYSLLRNPRITIEEVPTGTDRSSGS